MLSCGELSKDGTAGRKRRRGTQAVWGALEVVGGVALPSLPAADLLALEAMLRDMEGATRDGLQPLHNCKAATGVHEATGTSALWRELQRPRLKLLRAIRTKPPSPWKWPPLSPNAHSRTRSPL